MSASGEPTFNPLPGPSPIRRVALPLIAERGDQAHVVGTATLIHPRLALTARHVIDEYFTLFEGRAPEGDCEGTFSLVAAMTSYDAQHPQDGVLWAVRKLHVSRVGDMALLYLEPASAIPEGFEPGAPRIDVVPPAVGERVHAFGYPRTRVDSSVETLTIVVDGHTSGGDVTEIHHVRRDRSMLNFPCFEVNARVDGGMSGGPVFNADGHLCGIVCSSFEVGDASPIAYMSTLWPVLGMPITVPIENAPEMPYPARVLFERSVISAIGWDECGISVSEHGTALVPPDEWRKGRTTSAKSIVGDKNRSEQK